MTYGAIEGVLVEKIERWVNTLTDLANISTYWVENWNYDVIFQLEGAVYPRAWYFAR
jgi:hypothetical protein